MYDQYGKYSYYAVLKLIKHKRIKQKCEPNELYICFVDVTTITLNRFYDM